MQIIESCKQCFNIKKSCTTLDVAEVALAYKQLWMVEKAFREIKTNLELRLMYHWTESRIRGYIMICFLVFYLEMIFRRRLHEVKSKVNYMDVVKDLSRLQAGIQDKS